MGSLAYTDVAVIQQISFICAEELHPLVLAAHLAPSGPRQGRLHGRTQPSGKGVSNFVNR